MNQMRSNSAEAGKTRRRKLNKSFFVLLSLVLLVSIAAGATVAYLTSKPEAVSNSFEAGYADCIITEEGAVKNTGNIPAYVRVAVVSSLQDTTNGDQYAYATTLDMLEIDTYEGWSRFSDGYFYYDKVLKPGETSAVVGKMDYSSLENANLPEGYTFVVEMFAEAIQAEGEADSGLTPVQDAWKQNPGTSNAG